MNEASLLDAALKAAGVPIVGVSIGDPADRSTWKVHLLDSATKEQAATAAVLIQSVDVSATASEDLRATDRLRDPVLQALLVVLAGRFKVSEEELRDDLLGAIKQGGHA